jgi:hypothetical protein
MNTSHADTSSPPSLVRSRLLELRRQQRMAAVTDSIYSMVLAKLLTVGLTLTAPLTASSAATTALQQDTTSAPSSVAVVARHAQHAEALLSLLSGEAAQVVRAHAIAAVDGGSSPALPREAIVRCATAQLGQTYYTAMTLGYFVRAVDYRFRLDRQLRTLPPGAHAPPDAAKPGAQPWPFAAALRKLVSPRGAAATSQQQQYSGAGDAQAFAAYINSFRERELLGSLLEGLSGECKALMLRHVSALFGDVPQLHTDFAVR